MRRRFRWTRETYRQAARLARIGDIFHAYGREDQQPPLLLKRYWELWERHRQYEDPLAGHLWQRMQYMREKHLPDDIPF